MAITLTDLDHYCIHALQAPCCVTCTGTDDPAIPSPEALHAEYSQ